MVEWLSKNKDFVNNLVSKQKSYIYDDELKEYLSKKLFRNNNHREIKRYVDNSDNFNLIEKKNIRQLVDVLRGKGVLKLMYEDKKYLNSVKNVLLNEVQEGGRYPYHPLMVRRIARPISPYGINPYFRRQPYLPYRYRSCSFNDDICDYFKHKGFSSRQLSIINRYFEEITLKKNFLKLFVDMKSKGSDNFNTIKGHYDEIANRIEQINKLVNDDSKLSSIKDKFNEINKLFQEIKKEL